MLQQENNLRKIARLMHDKERDLILEIIRQLPKDYVHSYNITSLDFREPTIQLNDTKCYIENKLKSLLEVMRGFYFKQL